MAVTAKWYGLGLKAVTAQSINWGSDTIKCALVTSTYTPNQDTDQFWSTPQTNEVSGTGYTAGGVTLTTSAISYDTSTNEVRLDASDISWTAASFTARYAVVYKSTGTASTSPVLGYVDFGADETVSSGTFSITWDATGVLKITAS